SDLRGQPSARAVRLLDSSTRAVVRLLLERLARALDRLRQVMLVHLNADEIETDCRRGNSGAAKAEEGVHRKLDAPQAVELETELWHAGRKSCRMRPVFVAVLDRVVGNEPGVAPAAPIAASGLPARD